MSRRLRAVPRRTSRNASRKESAFIRRRRPAQVRPGGGRVLLQLVLLDLVAGLSSFYGRGGQERRAGRSRQRGSAADECQEQQHAGLWRILGRLDCQKVAQLAWGNKLRGINDVSSHASRYAARLAALKAISHHITTSASASGIRMAAFHLCGPERTRDLHSQHVQAAAFVQTSPGA